MVARKRGKRTSDGAAPVLPASRRKTESVLPCPNCKEPRVIVTDSRPHCHFGMRSIRRRRACLACGWKWTTFEVSEAWIDEQRSVGEKAKAQVDLMRTLLKDAL